MRPYDHNTCPPSWAVLKCVQKNVADNYVYKKVIVWIVHGASGMTWPPQPPVVRRRPLPRDGDALWSQDTSLKINTNKNEYKLSFGADDRPHGLIKLSLIYFSDLSRSGACSPASRCEQWSSRHARRLRSAPLGVHDPMASGDLSFLWVT